MPMKTVAELEGGDILGTRDHATGVVISGAKPSGHGTVITGIQRPPFEEGKTWYEEREWLHPSHRVHVAEREQ